MACWTENHRLPKIPQQVTNIARDIFIIAALALVVQSRLLHQHHAQPQQVALEQQELAVRVLADRNFQFAVNNAMRAASINPEKYQNWLTLESK